MGLPYVLYIVDHPITYDVYNWIKAVLPLLHRMLSKRNLMGKSAFSLENETDRITFSTDCSSEQFNEKILEFLDKHSTTKQ